MARNKPHPPAPNETQAPLNGKTGGAPLSEERIAERAYHKWLARGCPSGDDLRDWYEAQEELQRADSGATGTTA